MVLFCVSAGCDEPTGRTTSEVEVRILVGRGVDIYSRADFDGARPVLIYVPCDGDRAHTGWLAPLFTSLEFLFVPIDYGVTPGKAPPGHVEDVAKRIAWVLRNIEEYGGDPERLFVMGYSAGAHLVALIATDHRYLAAHGIELSAIRGAILFDNDVYAPGELGKGKGLDPWGDAANEASADWRNVCPGTHVASGKGIPPMLIVCSGVLTGTRKADVLGFFDLLVAAGVDVRLHVVEDRNHVTILYGLADPEDGTAAATADFLTTLAE